MKGKYSLQAIICVAFLTIILLAACGYVFDGDDADGRLYRFP